VSELRQKRELLRAELARHGRLLVAYSGGVDSAYLAWEARQVLGSERMLAVLADSPSLARQQLADAVEFAREHGIPLEIVATAEMERAEYVRNDAQRCFHCKDELFGVMDAMRVSMAGTAMDGAALAYGMNVDDGGDFRPGQRAAAEHAVVAPLAVAGLTKADVRALAREAGLRVWDKPASACLASRIEYGRAVTAEALRQVEAAEDALRGLGFRQMRVRHHGAVARVEIAREEMERALSMEMMARIHEGVRAAGFEFAAVDCLGYRSGSMNQVLKASNAVLPVSVLAKAGGDGA
jgi:uncharacterized protein